MSSIRSDQQLSRDMYTGLFFFFEYLSNNWRRLYKTVIQTQAKYLPD